MAPNIQQPFSNHSPTQFIQRSACEAPRIAKAHQGKLNENPLVCKSYQIIYIRKKNSRVQTIRGFMLLISKSEAVNWTSHLSHLQQPHPKWHLLFQDSTTRRPSPVFAPPGTCSGCCSRWWWCWSWPPLPPGQGLEHAGNSQGLLWLIVPADDMGVVGHTQEYMGIIIYIILYDVIWIIWIGHGVNNNLQWIYSSKQHLSGISWWSWWCGSSGSSFKHVLMSYNEVVTCRCF